MSQVTGVRARVYFMPVEAGGRRGPIFSGYRPQFHFGSPREGYDGVIALERPAVVHPGEQCSIVVSFLHPEFLQEVLKPGIAFEIQEGLRVVGRGTIVETISAANARASDAVGVTS